MTLSPGKILQDLTCLQATMSTTLWYLYLLNLADSKGGIRVAQDVLDDFNAWLEQQGRKPLGRTTAFRYVRNMEASGLVQKVSRGYYVYQKTTTP